MSPSTRASVVIVQEVLLQYRVPFYERLENKLALMGISLELVHGQADDRLRQRRDEGALSWARRVPTHRLPVVDGRSLVWQWPGRALLAGADLVVVEHASRHLLNYALLLASRLGGPRVAFWGHGANLQAAGGRRWSENTKRALGRRSHWWFAYTEGSKARVVRSGFPSDRVTSVQNSTATVWVDGVERSPHTATYLGALDEQKRIPFLLSAADRVQDKVPDFRLDIIGDGPLRNEVERWVAARPWARWHGAVFGAEKAALLQASSACLQPGMVGLSVVDALGAGTPVVTVASDMHSPEFEYLVDGVNGVVLDAGTGVDGFAQAVAALLQDPFRAAALSAGCGQSAKAVDLDVMVDRFAQGIALALAS